MWKCLAIESSLTLALKHGFLTMISSLQLLKERVKVDRKQFSTFRSRKELLLLVCCSSYFREAKQAYLNIKT